jgi:D-alanine-D-alanine ligase
MTRPKHVAVLMGGWSSEREVSLVSGGGIVKALQDLGHHVTAIDVQRDIRGLADALTPRPDLVFNALHGRGGEDGCIQGLLEIMGLPYTHSSLVASAIAMDKPLAKRLVTTAGLRCADGRLVTRDEMRQGHPLAPPYVLKPFNEGSSVGIRIVQAGDNLPFVDEETWLYGDHALAETFIPGRDLTVGVMGDRALTVTEIKPKTKFYDYTAKYAPGGSEHILPAEIPADVFEEAKRYALVAHQTLGCTAVSRTDLRYDDSKPGTTGLYYLETNTQPGFTPTSLLPEQAALCGISFTDLVHWITQQALCPA